MRTLAANRQVRGLHDVSSGGLAVALAEMAVRGGVGSVVDAVPSGAHLFAEGHGRVVASVGPDLLDSVLAAAADAGVPAVVLGAASGDRFTVSGVSGVLVDVDLDELTATWRDRLPHALGEGTVQG